MDYDDYNAVDNSGSDRFGNDNYGSRGDNDVVRINNGIPVVDRSTNQVNFNDDMFNPGYANFWDRLTGNTAINFLNRFDLEDANTFDKFVRGNPLDALKGPVSGDNSVYDPRTRTGYEIVERNRARDGLMNFVNMMINPFPGALHSFDSARVRGPNGEMMNYESSSGLLGSSSLRSDQEVADLHMQAQLRAEEERMRGSGDQTKTIDNTGGMLAIRDENGDIPWWVLANAGLLTLG